LERAASAGRRAENNIIRPAAKTVAPDSPEEAVRSQLVGCERIASSNQLTATHECRELAGLAQDDYSRRTLTQMGEELDAEADLIEAEEKVAKAKPSDKVV